MDIAKSIGDRSFRYLTQDKAIKLQERISYMLMGPLGVRDNINVLPQMCLELGNKKGFQVFLCNKIGTIHKWLIQCLFFVLLGIRRHFVNL